MPSKSAVLPFVGVSSQGSLRSRSFRSRVKGTRFFARDAIPYTENSSRYRSCCSSESRTESVASCTNGIFLVMLELKSSRITKETDSRSRSQYRILCSTPSSKRRKSSFFKWLATPPLSSKTITGTCTSCTLVLICTRGLACACAETLPPSHTLSARNNCHPAGFTSREPARILPPAIETREAPTGLPPSKSNSIHFRYSFKLDACGTSGSGTLPPWNGRTRQKNVFRIAQRHSRVHTPQSRAA